MATKNWLIDGKEVIGAGGATLKWEDRKYFTLEYKGHVYNGEVLNENTENNVLDIKINHRVFQVKKQGPLDDLIASLGMDKPKIKKLKELTAPMPGRIVSLAVEVGQAIEEGDEILSLEAMKMENVLKAEGVGIVKSILVKSDQVVDKGMVMIEFE
ncbi:MAG: acetyl-CoA carboxylase biotin carboxyl carrier protein subunit [Crocinitomicaceae bacterium]|jgi:biotin carboxyl carrier protein|nr:acetyl-CoA carboxylase biotin carboxyl carrier protein subunit [Crocinitomicaceae bacterium]MDG1857925.1 acetyl-CoA carboxylase biotin carboxyl carrier protein subunit [Emcibacteraceae bacterium]MDG2464613.1 acetyl-CoA carboxylase biotin carboxyl carrier protein subunit [Crocinitomicaceae bacterium]